MNISDAKERLADLDGRLAAAIAKQHAASAATAPRVLAFPHKPGTWQQVAEALEAIKQLVEHGVALDDMTPDAIDDVRNGRFVFAQNRSRSGARPLPLATPSKPASAYTFTDLGNAEYFVDLYRHVLRWDSLRRRWLEWLNHRWEPDGRGPELAQRAARRRLNEAVNMSGAGRDDAVKWAIRSESKYHIDSALSLAKDMSGIRVSTAEGWDADPWLLGTPNGVVDLRTGLRRDGRRDDYITKQVSVPFDPAATCPRWTQFIVEIFDGDDDLITYVRRGLGYTTSGDVSEDIWFGGFGHGANGKSVLLETLRSVLGDFAYIAPMSLVQKGQNQNRPDFQHAYLQHKRLVVASETSEGAVWDEEQLKKLSGGDAIHAEIKHGAEFNFFPTHKLWFMFNHQPRVRDHSHGFWRRVRLIPFTQTFTGARADKHLDEKLASEREGILAWLVRACLEWQRHGLQTPAAVLDASRQYQKNEDNLGEFIEQHVQVGGPGFYLKDAFWFYNQWAKSEGITHPLGRNRFGDQLESRGFTRTTKRNRPYYENCKLVFTCTCLKTPCVCLPVGGP